MLASHEATVRNRMLSLLPGQEFSAISRFLEPIPLPQGFSLAKADQPIDYVYFPESGIGSVIAMSPEGNKAEAGLFGFEGFSPSISAVSIELSPHEIIMQVQGEGHRIAADKFVEAMEKSAAFRRLLTRFAQTLATQIAFTALSNAIHRIDKRLARWLLMCHDRVNGDEIALTHEFIAFMLAVRRPSVTTALHMLEGQGFIRAERGCVIIRRRVALEEFAGDAYGKPEMEYRRLIGNL